MPKWNRRPTGAPMIPSRSVRVEDDIWHAAKKRAEREGATISRVTVELLEGYARGHIRRPETKRIYKQPA